MRREKQEKKEKYINIKENKKILHKKKERKQRDQKNKHRIRKGETEKR